MLSEALPAVRGREIDLAGQAKGHPLKLEIALQLRSASYVSNLLKSVDSKL
jgi:hypothetical protein